MELWRDLERIFPRTYTYRILVNYLELLAELWPYLAAGIVLVALLSRWLPRLAALGSLRRGRVVDLLIAALAGMAAPLPVYLAAPLAAVLVSGGLPLPVAAAFLVACPLIDPNLFLLTWGAFGPAMALARACSALALGLGAGLAVRQLGGRLEALLPESAALMAGNFERALHPRPFWTALRRQAAFILRVFGVSLLLAAAVQALVPPELVRALLGRDGQLELLAAIALGVPFYQCGGASIPLMQVLHELGLSGGAVLAFFLSGPATKLSALYAFRAGFGGRMLGWYLAWSLAGAFLAGTIYRLIP